MQIVIDIPEELYNYMQTEEYNEHLDKRFDYQIRFSIKNGTPLPKRTLDADELLKRISNKAKTPSLSEATVNGLCGATAIIYDMLESGQENMADIELVIKIPENDFKRLKKRIKFAPLDATYYEKTIANGTPLPKGHGRLKDENEIKRMIENANVNSEPSKTFAENIIRFAPTIIDADKERN